MVRYAGEQIAQQANASLNKNAWGTILYNATVYGVKGDGVTDDTAALQALVNTAIAAGRKAIFFPHTDTGGQYFVTALVNADQVVFFGDNASFVGGYGGSIYQMGDWATNAQLDDFAKVRSIDYLNLKEVIVFGDSISAGTGDFTPWTQYFSDYLVNIGGSVSNRAVAGNTISMTTTVINGVTDLNTYDVCIVFIGTNNIAGIVTDTVTDTKAMFDALNGYTGDLYLITPMHRDTEIGSVDTSAGGWQALAQINNVLYNKFSRKWKVLNGYDMGRLPLIDGLHPSTASSQLIADWIIKQVNTNGGNYCQNVFEYVNLPIESSNATILQAQGIVNSLTHSEHYISLDFTAATTGGQVVNLNYNNAGQSWADNAFVSSVNCVARDKATNNLVPALYQNIGGVRQILFDGVTGTDYNIFVHISVPNMQIV